MISGAEVFRARGCKPPFLILRHSQAFATISGAQDIRARGWKLPF
jgi:hypothetical protein